MNSLAILIITVVFFVLAYRFYGRFLAKEFEVNDENTTPAHSCRDGCDFVPAKNSLILFGHHFSSIAGAGPIIGPVIAATLYGWLGVLLWILLGAVFLGGVSDFSALVLSLRKKGQGISIISGEIISKRAKIFFSSFVILALILVNAIFALYAARTLHAAPSIALPSILLIPTAILFGWLVYKKNFKVQIVTLVALLLFVVFIRYANLLPVKLSVNVWIIILLVYCFFASILPVNILLQPRDYLSSFLLYAGMFFGIAGIISNPVRIALPAFKTEGLTKIWPLLFITVACGAISGFHTLIASGTTSKQISKESHSRIIGYGGMLIEGLLAVIALLTVSIGVSDGIDLKNPIVIFAGGFGKITEKLLGGYGSTFAFMLLNAFILTTLDTSTRITRYLFSELTGLKEKYSVTLMILIISASLAFSGEGEKIWPVFGASNQLVAALSLTTVTLWLYRKGKNYYFTLLPAVFMFFTTLGGLVIKFLEFFNLKKYGISFIPALLIGLAFFVVFETIKNIRKMASEE